MSVCNWLTPFWVSLLPGTAARRRLAQGCCPAETLDQSHQKPWSPMVFIMFYLQKKGSIRILAMFSSKWFLRPQPGLETIACVASGFARTEGVRVFRDIWGKEDSLGELEDSRNQLEPVWLVVMIQPRVLPSRMLDLWYLTLMGQTSLDALRDLSTGKDVERQVIYGCCSLVPPNIHWIVGW